MHIGVIGAGYVGLVTGVSLACNGHSVTLVERSADRVEALRAGRVPISEPGLSEAFESARERIAVVEAIEEMKGTELAFLCVGTPTKEDGEPDLHELVEAANALGERPDLHLSVRSTVPPGTSVRLPATFGRADGAHLSTNPEFLRQGTAMQDFIHPSRIVIGVYPDTTADHIERVQAAFAGVEAPRLTVSVAAAELIKNVANGFLALKLSFVNEVAGLAEEYGVDVDDILTGIALDPRIGSAYMRPGMGFGGSCLPKELQVLASAGRRQGLSMHVARAAAQVNAEQQDRFIRRVLKELPHHARVGLLGLSFKAFTDDLRGSPAVYAAKRLLEAGHSVVAYDPAADPGRAVDAIPGVEVCQSAIDVFREADAVIVGTEWPMFAETDFRAARQLVKNPLIFDGRNLLNPDNVTAAGFEYRGVGRVSSDRRS